MRLLHTSTLRLCSFYEPKLPKYAILSHTWLGDDDEVTYQELQSLTANLQCQCNKNARDQCIRDKKGYAKILSFCRLAKSDGFQYAWVDTCCIDKSSSNELSEAINSMYRWYKYSDVCYVYMVDVPTVDYAADEPLSQFRDSRWFKRGWTLQELLAPEKIKYLAQDWSLIGVTVWWSSYLRDSSNSSCYCSSVFPHARCLESEVAESSGIRIKHLRNFEPQSTYSNYVCIAERMSWAATRKTSRLEDMAYSMLGIFNINLPLIYGEGQQAFIRLQEEIIRQSDDKTILAWRRTGFPLPVVDF